MPDSLIAPRKAPKADPAKIDAMLLQGCSTTAIVRILHTSFESVARCRARLGITQYVFSAEVLADRERKQSPLDLLCLSGEPDRRAKAYRCFDAGLDDNAAAYESNATLEEVTRFRMEFPSNWSSMRCEE